MPNRYDLSKVKKANQAAALQRIAKNYPGEYQVICHLKQAHEILYKLTVDQFDRVLVEALHGMVKDGICKNPKF